MFKDQVVIYIGAELREAYLLRDLLASEGISAAVVSRGMSARLGLAASGTQSDVRVLVSQADALRARQLAVRFQGRRAAELQQASTEVGAGQAAQLATGAAGSETSWPRCPECNLPRTTRCPICGTAGSDFPPADEPEELAPDHQACAGEVPGRWGSGRCGEVTCGPGGTDIGQPAADYPSGAPLLACSRSDEGEPAGRAEQQLAPACICPTCDEPFRPIYHRRCQWCDYEFPDGEDYQLPADDHGKPTTAAIILIVVLALILVGFSAYVMLLF